MSCILVVRQDLIDSRPDVVQVLVDGIARSGLWLDTSKPHREDAADFVGRFYYNQKPALLRWALTKPMDRVTLQPACSSKGGLRYGPRHDDRNRCVEHRSSNFSDYADTRFSDKLASKRRGDTNLAPRSPDSRCINPSKTSWEE